MAKPTLLQTLFHKPSRSYLTEQEQPAPYYVVQHQQRPKHSSSTTPPPSRPTSTSYSSTTSSHARRSIDSRSTSTSRRNSTALERHDTPPSSHSPSPPLHRHSSHHLPTFDTPPPTPPPKMSQADQYFPSSSSSLPLPRRPRKADVESEEARRPDTIYYDVADSPDWHDGKNSRPHDILPTSSSSASGSQAAAGKMLGVPSIPRRHSSRSLRTKSSQARIARITEEAEDDDEDDDDEQVFVTPPSSPPSSPRHELPPPTPIPRQNTAKTSTSVLRDNAAPSTTPEPSEDSATTVMPLLPSISETRPISPTHSSWTESTRTASSSNIWSSPSIATPPTSVPSSSPKTDSPKASSSTAASSSASISRSHRRTKSLTVSDWSDAVKWLGETRDQYVRPQVASRTWTHIPKAQGDDKIDHTYVAPQPPSRAQSMSLSEPSYRRRSLDSMVDEQVASRLRTEPPQQQQQQQQVSLSRSNSSGSSGGGSSTSGSQRRPRRSSRTLASDSAEMRKRMSAVLEVDDDSGEVIGTAVPKLARSAPAMTQYDFRMAAANHNRSFSVPRPASVSTSSSSYRTVEIPSILDVSDGRTTYQNGFTSLTLPRAAHAFGSAKPDLISGNIDLTLSGNAQATMGTISIIKGGAALAAPKKLRRMSWSSRAGAKEAETPAHLRPGMASSLAFTTLTATPSKFGSSQVIIKVFAVALSDMDRLIVQNKVNRNSEGYGFVPGRAFVGRVLEAGWEVNDVRRGDWVMGLTEFGKSGALAEHIVVDRTRVARAPKPGEVRWADGRALTMEQVAVLPLSAVPAHRAVKTYPHVALMFVRAQANKKSASPSKSKAKAKVEEKLAVLVLGAHTGIGLMVVQEFLRQGDVVVVAHVPTGWYDKLEADGHLDGVEEVLEGDDPEVVMQGLRAGSYIMVVDCIGGETVRRVAKRVLDPRCGQFTTVVGDEPSVIPTRQAYTKSNMRSLRHVFGGKALGYDWVSPVMEVDLGGDDVRNSLTEIAELVERGLLVPPQPDPENIVQFERTMDLFKEGVEGDSVVMVVG